jgi:SNARE protein
MGKIQDDVDQIESNLKQADKQLRVFLRRLSSDKIFMILILLVLLGIIGSVVLLFMRPKYAGPPSLATGTKP